MTSGAVAVGCTTPQALVQLLDLDSDVFRLDPLSQFVSLVMQSALSSVAVARAVAPPWPHSSAAAGGPTTPLEPPAPTPSIGSSSRTGSTSAASSASPRVTMPAAGPPPPSRAGSTQSPAPSQQDDPLDLPTTIAGVRRLVVRTRWLEECREADVAWLLNAQSLSILLQRRAAAGLPPLCLGFDTEFHVDKLALVQLCCAERVLLIRVRKRTG